MGNRFLMKTSRVISIYPSPIINRASVSPGCVNSKKTRGPRSGRPRAGSSASLAAGPARLPGRSRSTQHRLALLQLDVRRVVAGVDLHLLQRLGLVHGLAPVHDLQLAAGRHVLDLERAVGLG